MGAGRQDSRRAEKAGGDRRGLAPGQRLAPGLTGPDAELLYGRHAVLEALRGRRRIHRVFLATGVEPAGIVAEIVAAARSKGAPVAEIGRETLERAVPANHQGVIAEAGPYPYVALEELLPGTGEGKAPLYLALDHLQDVQNLGTLLRTAEAMAVTGVLLPGRRAAAITAAAVNASAGAVEHLRIALVSNLTQALERLQAAGVWVVGLDAHPTAVPLAQADLTGPLALVVGAEGAGLSRLVRQHCDWLVAIPMYGRVASLNAAVAGSVALVAARSAQHRKDEQG
jgi:23S rRNA (guanosine2251-2'-O)-methyltransferase